MKMRFPAALAAFLLAACWSVSQPENDFEQDQANVLRIEGEARALARTGGCTGADQCRSAPLGVKACGGPRDYVVYCAASTDTVAFFRKLDELKQAETAFNQKYGLASNCAVTNPPVTELAGGVCRAR